MNCCFQVLDGVSVVRRSWYISIAYLKKPKHMKTVLAGLILLCAHTGACALDGSTTLQLSTQIRATAPAPQPSFDTAPMPELSAQSALVFDQASGQPLLEKNADMQTPIASITKLMTAMLVLDAELPLDERIAITSEDRDTIRGTGSRLAIGATYTRGQLLHLALIASDNRAAHALGRTYPGGLDHFVAAMNRTARALGMNSTVYVEPTGLSSDNRSTALDLAKLADYAYQNFPEICEITATGSYSLGTQRVVVRKKRRQPKVYYRAVAFNNTNRLTRMDDWHIGLSKTGFINEAGHCLVMQANVAQRDVIIVLLDAMGTNRRAGDAARIKAWLESGNPSPHADHYTPASRT
jgi:D-alanyl-D-alanine endopeptidase (penicillin-binding protein 7)